MTVVFSGTELCHVVCGGWYWIGWPAGYGGPAVVSATSIGLTDGTVVGGRSGDVTIQQKPIPKVEALFMTAVVLPPDSEIGAAFVVSGGRLGPCALVEPSRSLTEEYGVVVGHTLVDASSWSASALMINPNADQSALPAMCGKVGSDLSCVGGSRGSGTVRRYTCGPAGPFGGHCDGISSFAGGGGPAIVARPPSPV